MAGELKAPNTAIKYHTSNYQLMRTIGDTKDLVYDLYDTWAATYDEVLAFLPLS